MNGSRIVECFNSAKKLIFDSSWNQTKSPHVVALVFDKFTPLVKNTARELRIINESDQFRILFDAYQENLVRFSLINKQQKLEYTSCCFPYSTEEFHSFSPAVRIVQLSYIALCRFSSNLFSKRISMILIRNNKQRHGNSSSSTFMILLFSKISGVQKKNNTRKVFFANFCICYSTTH